MEFKIKAELLQAIANYLATKPFNEVTGLINELQKLEKVEEISAPAEPKTE